MEHTCCKLMADAVEAECIRWTEGEWHLMVRQYHGKLILYTLFFCPWCGARLTPSENPACEPDEPVWTPSNP